MRTFVQYTITVHVEKMGEIFLSEKKLDIPIYKSNGCMSQLKKRTTLSKVQLQWNVSYKSNHLKVYIAISIMKSPIIVFNLEMVL